MDPHLVSSADLLDLYFSNSSPFGKGKKKAEFPDAISLLSLQSWLNANDLTSYVISRDKDFIGFVEKDSSMLLVEDVASFVSLYNSYENKIADALQREIQKNNTTIKSKIQEAFLSSVFIYEAGEDVNVTNVRVDEVILDNAVVVSLDNGCAEFWLNANLKWTADVDGVVDESSTMLANNPDGFNLVVVDDSVTINATYTFSVQAIYDIETAMIMSIEDIDYEEGEVEIMHV